MEDSKNRQQTDHLGLNKMGKSIRKSPLHQPNFPNNPNRQQPQNHVYNISKNDFRNIVQQLTGSPARDPLPRPPQNPPKSPSMRLQKIRPRPLTPMNINRPHIVHHTPAAPAPLNNGFARPGPPGQFGQPSPTMRPLEPAESPISAYMRYLQNSMMEPSPRGIPVMPSPIFSGPINCSVPPQASGLHPNGPTLPNALPSPSFDGPFHSMPSHPAPRMNGTTPLGPLPSPTSQFLLSSPSGYMNFWTPGSPYPLLSPGVQFPPPSPGFLFPLSPSGFFPISSPGWRDQ